jgi:hypothetical protein
MPVRNRRAPNRLIPEPILVRPTKKRKYERPRINKIQEGPPWIQAAVSKTAEFLFNHFGKSLENEAKQDKLYEYWDRYGRSDCTQATFEKQCFICKEEANPKLQTGAGHEHEFDNEFIFCGVENCPKVYHKTCLQNARDRYSFVLNDTEVSCPWHHCSQCGAEYYKDITLCKTCPYSVCANCSGLRFDLQQSLCYECHQFSLTIDAPEMRMDLYENWKLYTVD